MAVFELESNSDDVVCCRTPEESFTKCRICSQFDALKLEASSAGPISSIVGTSNPARPRPASTPQLGYRCDDVGKSCGLVGDW